MATTFTIPLTTLSVGSQTFGPSAAGDSESVITITIDRTVPGGLNSLTSASILAVDVQESLDGGTTWQDLGGWTTPGGVITIKGVQASASSGTWRLIPGTARQVRATVTVSGPSSIVVSGSIVTQ